MADGLIEAFGSANIHKLRGNGISELGVHGCARSRSQDSGLVADFESCQDVPDTIASYYKHHSIEEHLSNIACSRVKKGFGHSRSMSNPLEKHSKFSLSLQMDANLNRSCDDQTGLCGAHLMKGHSAQANLHQTPDTDVLDRSVDTIRPEDDITMTDSENCQCEQFEEKTEQQTNSSVEMQESKHSCDSQESSEDTVGQLNSKRPELKLAVKSMDLGQFSRVRTISESSENESATAKSERRTRERTKSGCKAPPPKQSWLLRLFESKLFDMAIAIQYLFNSKEPGVQTYIGELML